MSRPTAGPRDRWIEEEWRLTRMARLALVRASRRPVLVLVVPLLLAGATAALRAYQPPRFEAILTFRLAEGDLPDSRAGSRPPRAIREYVSNVALSRHQLKQVMVKHGASRAWLASDPIAAVDDFREEISIEVNRNYFLYDRGRRDEPRTAQVVVSLGGSDAEQTYAMAHEIGQTILHHQVASRRSRLAEARKLLVSELERARARTSALHQGLERLSAEALTAGGRPPVGLGTRLAAKEAEARSAIEQALLLERRLTAIDFNGAAEAEQLGISLQLVDERLVELAPPLTPAELALLGAVVFFAGLLLFAPVVGAFDDRIHAPEDLPERGRELVGAFPRFPGDQAGSFRSRGPAQRRGSGRP